MQREKNQEGHPLDAFYSRIFRRYDLINRLFTFGLDKKWRSETALRCLEKNPEHVLDLCCGTADLMLKVQELAMPRKLALTGYDFNQQMLSVGQKKANRLSFPWLRFIQGDAASMPFPPDTFDAITIGFGFRNLTYQNPQSGVHLREINRVLKKGGWLYILESSVPSNRFFRLMYNLYLNVFLIPMGGLLSGDWKAYAYLARSSANFYSHEEVLAILNTYGFDKISRKKFFMGASNLVMAQKIHGKPKKSN